MTGMDTEKVLELSEFDISFDQMESKYQRKLSEKTLAEIMEVMSIYFYKIGEKKTAMRYYDLMKQLNKNHSATREAKRIVKPSLTFRILRKLFAPKGVTG